VSLALDDCPHTPPRSHGRWTSLLLRIADETELDGSVRVAGEPVAVRGGSRLVTAALTDALDARYFRASAGALRPAGGRRGGQTCERMASALQPRFLGRRAWTLSYRSAAGVPAFAIVAGGGPGPAAATCFLDLTPAAAPEAFAQLVSTLEGYGLGFRAELSGLPGTPDRLGAAAVTVAREHALAVARVALRMRQRAPLLFGTAVPAFTREVAPGVALADEPDDGTPFARHRCRLLASALVRAGHGAGPGERRAAVLLALTTAGLDPAALHLNPGNGEFGR
jgi:hypothetical protein